MLIKNLWRRRTRTLLTALGVAIGVAAVIALTAFGEGMADGFQGVMAASEADLTVGQKDAMMLLFSSVDAEVGSELKQIPGVHAVAGTIVGFVQMTDAPYFVVMGEDPRGFAMARYRLIAGGPITGRYQMLLGHIAARNFGKTVGDTFHLAGSRYRIVGIYETGVSMEDGGGVIGLRDAQSAFEKRDKVTFFAVQVEGADQAEPVRAVIEARWDGLAVTRTGEATRSDEFLDLYRSMGLYIGLFAALIGGLGMMNTTLMSVMERTREIGVFRALGWSRLRVVRMILGESLLLAGLGGLLGIGLGLGLIRLAQTVPAVEPLLADQLSPTFLLQAFGLALILGLVGSLYPAWRAAQLAPIEAMRYEGGAGGGMGRWASWWSRRAITRGPLRALLRRPARTGLTVVGIGLGVGFVVAMMGLVDGMLASFTSLAGAGQADLIAEQAGASDISFSEIDERVAVRLRSRPEVKAVSRILLAFPAVGDVPIFFIFGLDPQEPYIQHYRVREGRLPLRTGEIALGRFGAENLEKGIGDTLRLSGTSYTVVGIYENGSSYEDAGGLMLLKDTQELANKPRKVSLLAIQLEDPARATELAPALEALYPELMITRAEGFTERAQDFQTTRVAFNTLIGLTMVVGGVVMTNAMLMSVFERTQEIGVLRALGWRRRRVIGMVLAESIVLAVFSAGVGSLIGVGLNWSLRFVPAYSSLLTPLYTPWTFVQVLGMAAGLGSLGGLYPAWRAASLQPIEALRYE
ncbi:MAG: ABC transporter permease [Anaerolineales bacterium]|nr:ABC transporter permease [Anaerolineales bacterium]